LDRDVDHGPILIQKDINILEEDINEKLERRCGTIGAELLIEILPHYLDNTLSLIEQEHSKATFTRKFEKKEGEISLDDKAEILQNKYRAFLPHIPIFFFINKSYPEPFPKEREKIQNTIKQIRVKIISINLSRDFAENKSAKDIIEKVTPEGKSEMTWQDFERGYLK
jgi:methionyl-tRNA formyltransferase